MTDKQIIIDGYSLKDLKDLLFTGQRDVISTKTFEAIIETLERKEQECEELKKAYAKLNSLYNDNCDYTDKLEKTITEIKETAEKQCNICEALTPIDEYKDCKKCWQGVILQKISEVKDDNTRNI